MQHQHTRAAHERRQAQLVIATALACLLAAVGLGVAGWTLADRGDTGICSQTEDSTLRACDPNRTIDYRDGRWYVELAGVATPNPMISGNEPREAGDR
ncbi:hypothetical protein [Flindersiella endophytica]